MADMKDQTRLLFMEISASWVRKVPTNIVAQMVEGLHYAKVLELEAQTDQKRTTWDHHSPRLLTQETVTHASYRQGRHVSD